MTAAKALRWERRPEDRPQELLDAALRVFAANGYRSTRLEEVAEAAGVTKGTIYHYFDTKEELLLGVIYHYQAGAFGRIEEVLRDNQGSVSMRVRLLVRKAFLGADRVQRDLYSLLIRDVAHEVPDAYHRWLVEGPVRIWNLVALLVVEGQGRGEFRLDADGEVAARLLVSGLLLQLMWQPRAGSVAMLAIDEDRLVDSSVEIFLSALRPLAVQ
jgi:AcrR family transcriptional regulator